MCGVGRGTFGCDDGDKGVPDEGVPDRGMSDGGVFDEGVVGGGDGFANMSEHSVSAASTLFLILSRRQSYHCTADASPRRNGSRTACPCSMSDL